MNNIYLNVAGWKDSSVDDGPGIRSVLFLQGCSKQCPGCHNFNTHSPVEGKMVSVECLIHEVEAICHSRLLTISGGEPLEQIYALVILLSELKRRTFDICLYTGWPLERVPQNVLCFVDYIKVGHYVEKLRNAELQYYGSSNQIMYKISDGKVVSEVL